MSGMAKAARFGAAVLAFACVPAIAAAQDSGIDSGDTAWVIVSSALVLLMLPGLALFYGGMVRSKNVLSTTMHSLSALAIIGDRDFLLGEVTQMQDVMGNLEVVVLPGADHGWLHAGGVQCRDAGRVPQSGLHRLQW